MNELQTIELKEKERILKELSKMKINDFFRDTDAELRQSRFSAFPRYEMGEDGLICVHIVVQETHDEGDDWEDLEWYGDIEKGSIDYMKKCFNNGLMDRLRIEMETNLNVICGVAQLPNHIKEMIIKDFLSGKLCYSSEYHTMSHNSWQIE